MRIVSLIPNDPFGEALAFDDQRLFMSADAVPLQEDPADQQRGLQRPWLVSADAPEDYCTRQAIARLFETPQPA